MIDGLKVINLPTGWDTYIKNAGEVFVLKTCQRTLIVGFNFVPFYVLQKSPANLETFVGEEGYIYLLETICGLRSKVLAENEIVNQFKDSFQDYLKFENKNPLLIEVLEKLFKDAKEVRTRYLLEIGQQTYSGISRKLFHTTSPSGKILITGSGKLAEDSIKLLARNYDLYITARNSEKLEELAKKYQIKTVSWLDYSAYQQFDFILNTIGTDSILFDHSFFQNWINSTSEKRLFIDLGSPSVLETAFNKDQRVFRLDDIFEHSEKMNFEKIRKINQAQDAMNHLVKKRRESFTLNYPFGWEELNFV